VEERPMIHAREAFARRLLEERSRSDRSGQPFSVILIAMNGQEGEGRDGVRRYRALERFAGSVRLSDFMGWCSEDQIGLILPCAAEQDARRVLERLKAYLGELNRCGVGDMAGRDGHFSVMEYPRTLQESLFSNGDGASRDRRAPREPETRYASQVCMVEARFLERTSLCRQIRSTRPSAVLDRAARRCLDVLASLAGLAAVAPAMIVIALAVKLTSPGPVLFRQERVGQNGRPFTFLKFRSMVHNCDQKLHREYVCSLIENEARAHEAHGQAYFKMVEDPRITPLGRFLRKTSLDELPQLFNVLKGDMSLVGPRPPIGYEVERYRTWQLRRILEAKPGITGLWQISGRSTTTFDDMVRLDLRYVEGQSLWLNLRILLKTFKAVLSTRGAF
jgi:lipopolysaccharide/colanic/teichoic acid biosynthesis glycosyltransferase